MKGLVVFTDKQVDWVISLVQSSLGEDSSPEKAKKIGDFIESLGSLKSFTLPITITEEQIITTNDIIKELDEIAQHYSASSDITSLEVYDDIKKKISGRLNYLSTYKVIFQEEGNYLEEILKKEIRATILEELSSVNGMSTTKAKEMVESDKRYTTLRDQLKQIKAHANLVKTKYDYHAQLLQMVFQSVSTAVKERHINKHE